MQGEHPHSGTKPRKPELILPSERKFGMVFFGVFALIASIAFYRAQSLSAVTLIFGTLALLILSLTSLYPRALRPFNVAWMTLGLWLGKIVNPIVLGLIFLIIFTPLALILRLFRRDELALRRSSSSTTYWKPRNPNDEDVQGFKNQF